MAGQAKMNVAEKSDGSAFPAMLAEIWGAADGQRLALERVVETGAGSLPSVFATTDLAAASIAAAGLAVAEFMTAIGAPPTPVEIDRRLASFWFATSLRPEGWSPPPPWDPIAGDYRAADGWIRLHTNAPAHRRAALAVLGVAAEKESVAGAAAGWRAADLETAIVAEGGCAAEMRSAEAWATHPQGLAVAREGLVEVTPTDAGAAADRPFDPARPLAGIKVLDLTRVLAGPVATRFLAGYGAQVLRIDPPDWDEPSLAPEIALGKRMARLDLRAPDGRARFEALLAEADILIHGYRADALEGLGLGSAFRRRARPGLVDVRLDAYGWSGPWRNRRGFDSLVQMSAGIAEAGMRRLRRERPTPLPVQALDHATGYIMAAAAVLGLRVRLERGRGVEAKTSLARTARLLCAHPATGDDPLAPETPGDLAPPIEPTAWGPARRLVPPVRIAGAAMRWDRPAAPIGSHPPSW